MHITSDNNPTAESRTGLPPATETLGASVFGLAYRVGGDGLAVQ